MANGEEQEPCFPPRALSTINNDDDTAAMVASTFRISRGGGTFHYWRGSIIPGRDPCCTPSQKYGSKCHEHGRPDWQPGSSSLAFVAGITGQRTTNSNDRVQTKTNGRKVQTTQEEAKERRLSLAAAAESNHESQKGRVFIIINAGRKGFSAFARIIAKKKKKNKSHNTFRDFDDNNRNETKAEQQSVRLLAARGERR
jgi:hypothetical protein